ncbi:MAG: anaerobic sulfite reductase subunit AsrB, partial [Peptostreptococcus anaerobius]
MCNCSNPYIPVACEILEITKHTDKEWTFRTKTDTSKVKPGQFYEISLPKYGESPISVSGIGENYVDFTIRNVGKVTGVLFGYEPGDKLLLRGPYGNGFDINEYKG